MSLLGAEAVFHCICVLATIILSSKCIYDFFLNENISLVEYRSFQEFGHSGYPSISLCILYPFLENKLRMHGSGINVTSYVMFLNGSLSDERMAKIDYDNVTISLSDYFDLHSKFPFWIWFSNGTRSVRPLNHYVSLRGDTSKCFTVDVPFIEKEVLLSFGITIKNSIFVNEVRPRNIHFSKMEGLFVALHYPRQMLIASTPWKYNWRPRRKMETYIMGFRVKAITVVNKRDQSGSSCINDRTGYDQYVRDSIVKMHGCKPSFWKSGLDIAKCSPSELQNFKCRKPS